MRHEFLVGLPVIAAITVKSVLNRKFECARKHNMQLFGSLVPRPPNNEASYLQHKCICSMYPTVHASVGLTQTQLAPWLTKEYNVILCGNEGSLHYYTNQEVSFVLHF